MATQSPPPTNPPADDPPKLGSLSYSSFGQCSNLYLSLICNFIFGCNLFVISVSKAEVKRTRNLN